MTIGSICGPLSELIKDFHFMQNAGCNGNQKEKLLSNYFDTNGPCIKVVQIILVG